MKKFLLMAVVAFGMLATACSKDEVAQPVAGEESIATFTVEAPVMATRALGDGTTATELNWAVYDQQGNYLFGGKDIDGYKKSLVDLKATVKIPFVNGMAYNILFWAEAPGTKSPYAVDWDAKTVTYADGTKLANDENYDAFFCYYPVPLVTGPVTETVELKRPFAQLRIATNDTAAAALSGISVTDTKVTVAKTYTAFDFEDGDVTGTTSTVEFAYNVNANKAAGQIVVGGNTYDLLTVNYLFGYKGDKKLIDAKLTYKYGGNEVSADFSSVPIQQNYRTNIIGSLLTSEGNFNIEIEEGFDGEPGHKYEVVSVATAQELQNAVNSGAGEIILEDDIVLDGPIVFGTSTRAATANAYVLDLNGKELKGAVDNSVGGFVKNNGTLIVKNGTITSTATNGAAAILNTGILTVENATLNGAPSDLATGYASYALNTEGAGSEVVLNNVNISGRGAVGATKGTKVEINSGNYHTPAVAWAHAIYAVDEGTEVTINGGTFSEGYEMSATNWGMYQIYSGKKAKVVVKDGDFSQPWDCANGYDLCTATEGTIEIFGGVFAENPASQNGKNYLATEDYEAVEENGVWKVKVVANRAAVVTVNGVDYPSIKAAVKAAKKGDAVVLIDDMTLADIIVLNKSIVFDGNGKTLTSTAGRAINVEGADGVTIKDLTIECSGERAINVIQNSTNVKIENVTATAANYTVNVAASAPNAVVDIKGSTLNGLCTVNVASAGAEVTVDGCTVNCNDNDTTEGESYAAICLNKDAVGGKITVTDSTINVTAGSDSMSARNGAPNGTITIDGSTENVRVMVAAITYEGSNYYYSFETLEEAVEFAKEGDVITLLRSIEVEDKVVLDLGGKSLKAEANFEMFKVKNGGELTLKNGKFEAYAAVVQSVGGKVIIENGEYTQTGTAVATPATYRYCIDCREGGEIIINGGTFKSNNGMINVGSTVTINGGKFENIVEKTMTRHFAYVSAPLTINGGEFKGIANSAAGGCFFCGAAAGGDIQITGGKFTSLWTSGGVNRIFEYYYGGTINVTGGLFNTNGGIADFVVANDDAATKDAYPYKAK